MAPKKAKTMKRDQKHGKNGKKEGLSGSSFFTWFMVIALLGVWTSVAVVWFDLVDYEEFLGKLGDYDADGDGDFDVDDAKVLLGLKERSVSQKISEDLDETDSIPTDFSDADLEDAGKDSLPLDNDVFDLEDALDDYEIQDDTASEFSLEDAVEPSVHASLTSEPEVKEEPEEEPVLEEQVDVEEQPFDEVLEDVLEQEPAVDHNVEEATLTHEERRAEYQEPDYEHEVEETETEFLSSPNTETEEPLDGEEEYLTAPLAVEEPAPVADEEPDTDLTEEREPRDENFENQESEVPDENSEYHEESFFMVEEDLINEPTEDETISYEEVSDSSPQIELEEEEPAELSDDPDGETAPDETEDSAPETSEADEDTIEAMDDIIDSEEIDDVPLVDEPSDSPAHEHVEVEQSEIPENPVVDDRPSKRVEEQDRHTSDGQQGDHADT